MIKEITYSIDTILDCSLWYKVPCMNYFATYPSKLPDECIIDLEITQLPWEYIRQIVKDLDEVKKWKKEYFHFWFETTMIWCYQKWKSYYWEIDPDSEVTISYNYADDYVITNLKIDDILKMMTDYRDFVDAWEKRTWKIKKGG
jgi:hypothetical protein